ncbi:MAG: hypothetical protein IPJ94_28060 [Chloroflexi bacterium]|nr:hypothetical protein [Chloroflexota bacterium]
MVASGAHAYLQFWVGRHLANSLPRPWERNLPEMKAAVISPTLAQRDWGRIIRQLGHLPNRPNRVVIQRDGLVAANASGVNAVRWSLKDNSKQIHPDLARFSA